MIKSKDFTIFQIRYYADGINVRKGIFGNDSNRVQHHQRAEDYNKFFWQMVEQVTGRKSKYYSLKYFLSSRECAVEELFDKYDILIPDSEEYYYWFIPIHMPELSEWIQKNCNLPFKVVKRSPYSSCLNNSKTNWRREQAEAFTKEHLPQLNEEDYE
jgi:hypothetical protein